MCYPDRRLELENIYGLSGVSNAVGAAQRCVPALHYVQSARNDIHPITYAIRPLFNLKDNPRE